MAWPPVPPFDDAVGCKVTVGPHSPARLQGWPGSSGGGPVRAWDGPCARADRGVGTGVAGSVGDPGLPVILALLLTVR